MRGVPERFACRLRVRYNECDPQGIVFNANYFTYFDIALTEFFRAAMGGYTKLFDHDCDLVVREASARFNASAGFDDELELRVAPVHLGRSSMVTEIDVLRGDEALVRGRMVHVFVEREGLAAREMPEGVRTSLSRWVRIDDGTQPETE
jgi:acyl-CoA thioester hydrolase